MPPETSTAPIPPTLPHDLANPEDYLPGTPWWIWALIGLAAILLLSVLIHFIMKQVGKTRLPALPPENPFKEAQEKFQQLKAEVTNQPLSDIATRCSLVMRECLGAVFKEQALYETDEEIKLRPNSFSKAPEKLRPKLIEILEDLGMAKYAPSQSNEGKSNALLDRSSHLINELEKSQTL